MKICQICQDGTFNNKANESECFHCTAAGADLVYMSCGTVSPPLKVSSGVTSDSIYDSTGLYWNAGYRDSPETNDVKSINFTLSEISSEVTMIFRFSS